ncbi:Chromodomain Y-like protein 2 [Caligus rogercresseyi]|uniref:Chromodomain Y-like protein 2 n=1 Tax=Caligus rogercresseyi TaxID=217165 RepID=A0A7T8GPX9_CALRO|nr:Chromodomain Y-like protein 2 [Caligus rogercresseyi]
MDAISVLRKDLIVGLSSSLDSEGSSAMELISVCSHISLLRNSGKNAESLANAIRRLVLSLLACEELALVAAVNGEARGLGVSWLPLFDVVFASDKAVLSTPYARLGMIPEAGARTTFSSLLPRLSEMTLLGKSITALEAKSLGLVSDVLWPDKFFEEIIPRLQMTSLLSSSGIQILKKALKEPLKKRVLEVLDEDTKTLASQWASPLFVKNAKAYLKTCHHV